MKKLILVFLIIHCSLLIAEAQWIEQFTGVTNTLRDIEFINKNTGWICGDGGLIMKTTNGGTNWIVQINPAIGKPLFGIHPVDSNVIYCVGLFETIIKSTNGGANWNAITNGPSGEGNSHRAVFFLNKDTGWISRSLQAVLKTTNGGLSFDTVFCPYGGLDDFYFRNALEGLGCKGMVKTTDGGNSWEYIYIPIREIPQILRLSIVNYDTGYCITTSGKVLKTTDFGSTWDSISFIPNLGSDFIRCTEFSDINTGYAAGEFARMYKTTDRGINWRMENTGPNLYNFFSLSFINDSIGWACKDGGIILKTTTGGQTNIELVSQRIPQEYILHQNYPNPFNGQTTFEFEITKEGIHKIIIYDLLGREMINLFEKNLGQGVYKLNFDSKDLPTGTYFYRLFSDEITLTKSFQLIK